MANDCFFTSDTHFFHKKIIEFCPDTRQGDTVDEMHELIIEKWNSQVSMTDTVYILGDFSFAKAKKTLLILPRLKGRLHLVRGNHDYWIDETTRPYFESISDIKHLKFGNQKVMMCHHPIIDWTDMSNGAYHFHGHTHGDLILEGRAIDVGIDARPQKDMGLWVWEELDALMQQRPINQRHQKKTKVVFEEIS